MHDKIAREDWNLLAHFGVLSLEFLSGLGLLKVKLSPIVVVSFLIFHNRISKDENSKG